MFLNQEARNENYRVASPDSVSIHLQAPRIYKKKFMLNSAEHEILNAHNTKKFSFFFRFSKATNAIFPTHN